MEEGDSLATEQKKKPKNCWSVKVWKCSFPFPHGKGKRSFQGPEIVKRYFSSSFFEAQGNLKSHGYSSLVTILFQNWGLFRCCVPFRPPGILCSVLYESCHVYGLSEIVESFFYCMLSRFSFLTSHSLPWNHAEWLSSTVWRLICSHVSKSSITPCISLSLFSFIMFLDT